MVPVIIGAAALAAGAGIGFALGKNDKPKKVVVNNVIQKAEVSEDYVKWQLDRAGKNLQKNYIETSDKRAEKIKNIVDIVNHLYFKRVIE